MEKFIELKNIFNYIPTILLILFLLYVLVTMLYNKGKYISYLPLFIISFSLLSIYIVRTFLFFHYLDIFLIIIWIFQTIYWFLMYKNQKMYKTIYNFIFKKK